MYEIAVTFLADILFETFPMLLVGPDTCSSPTMQETQSVSPRDSAGKNPSATDFSIAAIMAKGSSGTAKESKAANDGKCYTLILFKYWDQSFVTGKANQAFDKSLISSKTNYLKFKNIHFYILVFRARKYSFFLTTTFFIQKCS